MGDMDLSFIRTVAVTGLLFAAVQGIPRAFRTVYNWTAAALFSSLAGTKRRVAMLFAVACALWVFVLAGAVYSPIALITPRAMPLPDGAVRWIILIEFWVLVLLIPLAMGATEAYFSKGSLAYRLSMLPLAFVHVLGMALALLTLIPWIVWRFIAVRLTRQTEEQLRVEIDPDKYESVTAALVATLRDAGLPASTTGLPAPVSLSRVLLHRLGPPMLRPDSEYEARRIRGDGYSLLVFDGLIDAVATRDMASRVRLGLLGGMPPDGLWLTQSEGARELEQFIRAEDAELRDVPQRIAAVDATLDEWRVLSWEYMQVLAKRGNQDAGPDAAT
jgi:hypothetical protein